MEERILGIDLSDMGTILSYYAEEDTWKFPTVICRRQEEKDWVIGETAYSCLLHGSGIITDKLLTLVQKNGNATLYNVRYSATDLLTAYLSCVIAETTEKGNPTEFVLSVPEIDILTVSAIRTALCSLGYSRDRIHIISRSESFIYYVMSQNQELRNNNVAMFSLEDNLLTYYELKAQRKAKIMQVYAEKEVMDESFSLDIIKNYAGAKLADKILTSCAERVLKNKVFSAVILTGPGFENYGWAENFMKLICTRRKVFVDDLVFSHGAAYRGVDFAGDKPVFRFVPICEGRVECSVFVDVDKNNRSVPFPLVNAGECWYEVNCSVSLIPYAQKELVLSIVPMDGRRRKTVRIPIDFLPDRPPKTTTLRVSLDFLNASTFRVSLKDDGFGELFPATGAAAEQEVNLWD